MNKKLLTSDEFEYFKTIIKGNTTKNIQEMILKKYNKKLSLKQILNLKSRYNLKSDVQYMVKGRTPHNYKHIGSEFKRADGYVYIKTCDKPKKWQRKQRYIYEQYYGKIPKGYYIIFLDQDKTNFDIKNLKMIKRNELTNACGKKLLFKNRELTESALLIQKIVNKTKQIEKKI